MPLHSAEIRWFAKEKETLWKIFKSMYVAGEGKMEDPRTDFYLRSNTIQTGVKIRDGNHEIKVKTAEDEPLVYGKVEYWIKWSTKEENDILKTVDSNMLGDWIGVSKKRFMKKYEIIKKEFVIPTDMEIVNEGCGIEFTELKIEQRDSIIFTLGFEAFSAINNYKENLMIALKKLNDEHLSYLKDLPSCGYPEYLFQRQIN